MKPSRKLILILVVMVGLAIRLFLSVIYHTGLTDVIHFQESARIFLHGGNIYAEQYFYNYSPTLGIPLALIASIPLPFFLTWRIFLTLISLINAILIARLSSRSAFIFMLFWLNPALIILDGYYGQFEALAMLPILLALYHKKGTFALGTLSILVKHLTLPLTWALFVYRENRQRAVLWMLAALALFFAAFIPYLPAGAPRIVTRVFMYTSSGGYGFGSSMLFYAAITALPFIAKSLGLDLIDGLLFIVLGQFVTTAGASVTHFYMVLALALVRPSWWLVPLTAVSVLLASPWTHLELYAGAYNALWIVALVWFIYLFIKNSRINILLLYSAKGTA